jgi:hypothetical protein
VIGYSIILLLMLLQFVFSEMWRIKQIGQGNIKGAPTEMSEVYVVNEQSYRFETVFSVRRHVR